MDMRIFCKLCDEKHLAGQHNLRDVEPRPWLRGFSGADPVATKVRTEPPSATKVLAISGSFVACGREGCENPVPPKEKGRPGKFCSDSCRKTAYRASRKGDGE